MAASSRIMLYCAKLFIVVNILLRDFVTAQEGFFFTVPKVLREGDNSEFCLTAYASGGDTRNVTISMINRNDPLIKVEVTETYSHGQQKCSNFTVPEAEDYEILLHNDTDILHDSVQVTVKSHSQITLIQTDKPMYKPGQTVKFRILTIKSNQKPRIGTINAVYVKDPHNSRVKQFLDVDSQGIASLQFQLSKEAKIGRWQVLVFLNETESNEKEDGMVYFEVKEYVLPRFEVTITPPSYIISTDEAVEGKVCAKYTYGKDVQGFLEINFYGEEHHYGLSAPPLPYHHEVVKMNGCHNFSVNMTKFREDHLSFGWQLKIDATVTEGGTGSVVKAETQTIALTREEIKLTLSDYTNGFFKPGLPFRGKVTASKPDGQPAVEELISITAFDYDRNVKFSDNFTTDESGVVHFALCGDFDVNITTLSLMAEALNHTSPPKGMYSPRANGEIRQWFSPSFSYIEIPRSEAKLKCDQKLNLKIPFTTQANINTEFLYQIISRGKVVVTDSVGYNFEIDHPSYSIGNPAENCLSPQLVPKLEEPEPTNPFPQPPLPPVGGGNPFQSPPLSMPLVPQPPLEPFKEPIKRSSFIADTVSSFNLEIPIASIMAPKFTLLIHHVLPDGEIVADSMEFQVEPCFENKINMTFSKDTVLPGEKVNVQLEAEPGSLCSLGIIDKSVNLLGGKHQITMDTIFEKIQALGVDPWSSFSYQNERDYCKKRIPDFIGDGETYMDLSSRFVDAKQAFESSGLIVVTNLKLETRPCEASFPFVFDSTGPFTMLRMGTLGAGIPGPRVPLPVAVPLEEKDGFSTPANIRSHFPETWLWDLQTIGENRSLNLPQVAPHTITNWVGNALCIDSKKGVGVSPLQSLTTFQPFFIHLNLPYAAVRGERLPIIFTVHNYLDKCLHMQLKLDGGKGFKVFGYRHRKPFCVCGGKSHSAKFYAIPLDIGSLPIVAKAEIIPGTCKKGVDVDLTYVGLSDAVKRQMLVKAEGVTKEYTRTLYMCAKENETQLEDIILPMPEDIVKHSARGDIKVIGDIMGPALTNLDNLVRMPTGCGEQNMVGFTPNIFVLKYLGNTGLLTEEIHDKAINFMEVGYQRELNYRHRDGSYSAFGKTDERGSVWLTAFVVKSFAQAADYIYIDPDDIEQSVRFLKLSQAPDGCFHETGKVFSSYMMGGLSKKKSETTEIALTSYVLIALLQAGVSSNETAIIEGFKCIDKEYKRVEDDVDVYSLTISALANTMNEPYSISSMNIMKKLQSKAKKDGSLKYWNRDGIQPPSSNSYYYRKAPSAEVEMTAYALMAYLTYYREGAIPHSHEIAMWLSQQRNPYGGFASTQDTVVGLNALSEFAVLIYDHRELNVNVSVTGNDIEKTFHVSEKADTKLLLQKEPITLLPNRVRISTRGEGCALVQANVRFNQLPQNIDSNRPVFQLKIMPRLYRHDIDRCDRRTINFVVGSRGKQEKHSQGMSLVVVKMITSWAPIKESLLSLESQFPVIGMNRLEYDEKENTVTFYFDELKRRPHEFTLDVEQDREMAVSSPKAGQVSIINYYETDVTMVKSYTLKTTCGTKASIPRNRIPPIDPRRPIPVQTRISFPPLPPLILVPSSFPETEAPPTPPPSPSLPIRFLPPASGNYECPICRRTKSFPPAFKDVICNSSYIYKSIAGRTGTYSLKVKEEVRSSERVPINTFANITMPAGCSCPLLTPPASKIFIMTSTILNGKMLTLDGKSAITYSTRIMERELRKIKKTCPPVSPP